MKDFIVDQECRLDVFLSTKMDESRSQLSLLIKDGFVKVNNKIQNKNSFKLKINDIINLNFPDIKSKKIDKNIDFDIEILYEDEDLLVLNKPCNLVVHGASSVKEFTLVDWLMSKKYSLSSLNGINRAGLVHRLDKGTSGAIIIAKNNLTHQYLSKQLENKTMGRFYLALINKSLKNDKIIIEKPIIRAPNKRIKKLAIDNDERINFVNAKYAKTAFINLATINDMALIVAKLFTGRTHQIRAHLQSINRHILGDELYGYKGKDILNIMLHAYFIYFIHPKTKEKLYIKAPLRDDFKNILKDKIILGEFDETISLDFIQSSFDSFV